MVEGQSILIVDDDPTQIAILHAYFTSARAGNIHQAGDGNSALAIVNSLTEPLDLIVSDLGMPGMDGFEFLRHLKATAFSGKIALFSGHDHALIENAASLARIHGLKIVGQLKKPLTKRALDMIFSTEQNSAAMPSARGSISVAIDDVIKGIQEKQFIPYYQPKIDFLSGKVVGAEALARWRLADNSIISPAHFIALAEQNNLIEGITMSILDSVLDDINREKATWNGAKISINLPPAMLNDVRLPDTINRKLAEKDVRPSSICFEITESGILEFNPSTLEILSRLRIAGFDLAIDDFGTGAANISNLRMFPYSELKIDQSFINNILTDAFSEETVRVSLSLARQLNMRVVAEGIESQRIFDHIKSKGIDQAQGYFIGRPMPAKQMNHQFADRHAWLAKTTANLNAA
jgi:EAL domain-containing protein (putative c-di-GMP-specific phosphodiesterase class I)/ActR/RegA family two-component response regulator